MKVWGHYAGDRPTRTEKDSHAPTYMFPLTYTHSNRHEHARPDPTTKAKKKDLRTLFQYILSLQMVVWYYINVQNLTGPFSCWPYKKKD